MVNKIFAFIEKYSYTIYVFVIYFCICLLVFQLNINKIKKEYEDALIGEVGAATIDYFPLVDDEETAIKLAEIMYEKIYDKKISKEYTNVYLNEANNWVVYCYDTNYKNSDDYKGDWDMCIYISKNAGIIRRIDKKK